MKQPLHFQQGIRDGLPIGLGYFPVSMTFGMLAINEHFPFWSPILISLTSLTGTGQFIGIDLIINHATLLELAFTILLINIRYFLMSLSLLQKLPNKITFWQKLLIAFGVTDENYAVAMQQREPLTFSYIMGILSISLFGWTSGTAFGTLVTDFIPETLLSAFGIAIYGMFLAIIIPASMENKTIFYIVISAIVMSCLCYVLPVIKNIGSGWILILCGVTTSGIFAYLSPIKEELMEEENE